MDIKTLSGILQENGVVGAGGAGFPTYAKLDERANTIILNCAECEPLLKLHQQLLEKYAYEILKTFSLVGETVKASEMIIGIKEHYKDTIAALNQHIGKFPGVRLGLLEEVYPAGDEVVLIYEVTKKVVRPGGLPIEQGVAVFNVETIYNLYRALERSTPVVDKLVSVVAEVKNPVTVRVPLGVTIGEVVALAGRPTVEDPAYFVGGPMMGFLGSASTLVTKTTNAVLVLSKDHPIVQKKNRKASIDLKRAAASCCQCQMCTDLCPRHALGHPIEPHLFMRAATCKDVQDPNIFLNTFFCSGCGLCEMYSCFQSLAPRTLIGEYKNGLRAAGVKPPHVEAAPVGPERELRKAPIARLKNRLDLARYDVDAPLKDETVEFQKVRIPLRQHIGAPAQPAVKPGDIVGRGQKIANPAPGALSVAIHASIAGTVLEADKDFVVIENK